MDPTAYGRDAFACTRKCVQWGWVCTQTSWKVYANASFWVIDLVFDLYRLQVMPAQLLNESVRFSIQFSTSQCENKNFRSCGRIFPRLKTEQTSYLPYINALLLANCKWLRLISFKIYFYFQQHIPLLNYISLKAISQEIGYLEQEQQKEATIRAVQHPAYVPYSHNQPMEPETIN